MRGKNEMLFFTGYLLSAFGNEFVFFVMTVHVYALTGSALDVGIFSAVSFVPRMLAPLFGIVSDRYDKNRIFAAACATMAVLIAVVASIQSTLWIYTVWFGISMLATMIMNVRTLIMVNVMRSEGNLHGNSMVLTILSTARIAAPFTGGLIAVISTPQTLLFMSSIVYLFAASAVLGIKLCQDGQSDKLRTTRGVVANIIEGALFIARIRVLRTLATIGMLWRLFLGLQVSIFVVYVKECLGLNSSAYGIFLACFGLGGIAGSLIGPYVARRLRAPTMVFHGMAFHYLSFAALGIVSSFPLAIAMAMISNGVFYTTLVGMHWIRDQVTDDSIRGRVYGAITAILTAPGIVSMVLGGYLAEVFGAQAVILTSGLLAFSTLIAARIGLSEQHIEALESGRWL